MVSLQVYHASQARFRELLHSLLVAKWTISSSKVRWWLVVDHDLHACAILRFSIANTPVYQKSNNNQCIVELKHLLTFEGIVRNVGDESIK